MILYRYTGFEYALDDILNHHIKVVTLDTANDPNEWLFCTKKPDGTYYPIEWVRNWWHARYTRKIGFLSFSGKNDNPVMWSHYAVKHTGIVLGFESRPASKLFQVEYHSERVEFLQSEVLNTVPPDLNDLYKKLIAWKYKGWEYEEEWRAYIAIPEMCRTSLQNGKLIYFFPFDRTLQLKEIVIGCDAQGRINEIQNALHYGGWKNVAIKFAKLSQTDYRMGVEDYESTNVNSEVEI